MICIPPIDHFAPTGSQLIGGGGGGGLGGVAKVTFGATSNTIQ